MAINPLKPAGGPLRNRLACLVPVALVWVTVSCISALFIIVPAWQSGDKTGLWIGLGVGLLFEIPFALVGIGLLVMALRPAAARLAVAPPQISLTKQAVRVGEGFGLTFQQAFKRSTEVQQAEIKFVLRETARYRRGTDTYTVKHEHLIDSTLLPPRRYEAGETLTDSHTFTVPAGGMHTFQAGNNRLDWLLIVKLVMAGWPDFNEEYAVTVLPEKVL
jgi:hypothetical protein